MGHHKVELWTEKVTSRLMKVVSRDTLRRAFGIANTLEVCKFFISPDDLKQWSILLEVVEVKEAQKKDLETFQ